MRLPLNTSGGTAGLAPLALVELLTAEGVTGSTCLLCHTPLALKPVVRRWCAGSADAVQPGSPVPGPAVGCAPRRRPKVPACRCRITFSPRSAPICCRMSALRRVQRVATLQVFHGARTAIALGAPFLGARAAAVLAQPLQHGARGRGCRGVDLYRLALVEEAGGAGVHRVGVSARGVMAKSWRASWPALWRVYVGTELCPLHTAKGQSHPVWLAALEPGHQRISALGRRRARLLGLLGASSAGMARAATPSP